MPVIIERQSEGNPESLLHVGPEHALRLWRVGKAVGNVKNDGPELIKPVEAPEPQLL